MQIFGKLCQAHSIDRYGNFSNVEDGSNSLSPDYAKAMNVFESSPKRLLRITFPDYDRAKKEYGRLLVIEMEARAKRERVHVGHCVLLDYTASEFLLDKRKRLGGSDLVFGSSPLARIIGIGLGFMELGDPHWGATLLSPLKYRALSKADALEVTKGAFGGEPLSLDKYRI
jgi:hypothetical protein